MKQQKKCTRHSEYRDKERILGWVLLTSDFFCSPAHATRTNINALKVL